jgi:hypothetical protein
VENTRGNLATLDLIMLSTRLYVCYWRAVECKLKNSSSRVRDGDKCLRFQHLPVPIRLRPFPLPRFSLNPAPTLRSCQAILRCFICRLVLPVYSHITIHPLPGFHLDLDHWIIILHHQNYPQDVWQIRTKNSCQSRSPKGRPDLDRVPIKM